MIEIKYKNQYEVTDLAGCTVSEARTRYQEELGIPAKAYVKLNGSKLKAKAEAETVINDDDRLSFGVSHPRGVYYLTALLLALAITGGVFASGFINGTASINASTVQSNFADVTANTTGLASLTWTAYGKFSGKIATSTNGTAIFNVDTSSGYTGDLVVTVSYGNVDELLSKYRVLDLQLGMTYPDGSPMDINEDGTANATTDWVMLTLENGSVSLYPGGTANYTQVRVTKGFYITQVKPNGVWGGSEDPELFCEVAQR